MVLNIDLFREEFGGKPQLVKDSEKQRYRDPDVVDRVIEKDRQWRKCQFVSDQINRSKNTISKAIGDRLKQELRDTEAGALDEVLHAGLKTFAKFAETSSFAGGHVPIAFPLDQLVRLSVAELRSLSTRIDEESASWKQVAADVAIERDAILAEIGNLIHSNVPISKDEADNRVERTIGDVTSRKKYSHVDLVEMIDGFDGKRGAIVAGSRGYYLKGPLVFLQQALVDLSLHLLLEKGFTALYTPVFMRKEVMTEVAQLSQFDEELYNVGSRRNRPAGPSGSEDDEKYLIATSEQPIAAFHRDETLLASLLPIRYAGVSSCFRLEAGSHGRDTRGIFRVHQFEKVEQFCLTEPAASWSMLDEMVTNTEELYKKLGLGYRVVNIVSGELNNAAAMKFDIEAWFPGSGTFRELASCSNCTDYQARSLRIRVDQPPLKPASRAEYVHMLNATMCAATRTMCAVLETCQTETGIAVPIALQPFMPEKFRIFIPFVKNPLTNSTLTSCRSTSTD